ncbi:MAG: hypothetical protein Unbinned338contig1000_8 [Prokaryotic dsDNA virus sp.]|nr:MAG: hypothetical protein Unbinned338contig1000_8 [Prokaryotic dsDNA virus sp.]|tara:strand:- start:2352 stop:2783 length:432 start_codon:yes stop_codon:yes gene_type:complete
MTEERDWREAKPKWAIEAAAAEMKQWQITAALAWPREAKPDPLPFMWVDYDRCIGEPVAGTYWSCTSHVRKVSIRERDESEKGWKSWRFKEGNYDWNERIIRGALYRTEREAALAQLWAKCEDAAKTLHSANEILRTASDCSA